MKKFLFLSLLFCAFASSAQLKLGLKIAPVIADNRATNEAQTAEKDGSTIKFSIGLIADKPFADTYLLSSGLVYLPKRVAFVDNSPVDDGGEAIKEEYNVQYLQIPVSVKLFTNEVAPDLKVYFQVGTGLEIKVFDEAIEPQFTGVESFNPIDIPVILGTGVEFRAGLSTTIFGGISYQRGLVNTINQVNNPVLEDLAVRNTVVSFDLGVKF